MNYKKKSMLVFVFLIIISTLSANVDHKRNNEVYSSVKNMQRDTIFLFDRTKSTRRVSFFQLGDFGKYAFPITFRSKDSLYFKKILCNDTLVLVEEKKYTPFVIIPGETLTAKENDKGNIMLEIKGDSIRNNELLFFVKLDETIQWPFAPRKKITTKEDFKKMKNVYKSAYEKSIEFLETYSKIHIISKQFYDFSIRYLYYKCLQYMFNPNFYSLTKNLSGVLKDYKNDFEKDENMIVPTYSLAADCYSHLLLKQEAGRKSFEEYFNFVENHFEGDTRKYLLYRSLINNVEKDASNPIFKNCVSIFLERYPTDTLSKLFTRNYDYINNNPSYLRINGYQNENLLNDNGQFVTWKGMLERYKGKVIYIDFWATWCGPCISEFPYYKKLRKQFKPDEIAFVYISKDVEKVKWLAAIDEFGLKGYGDNFLFAVPDNSLIKKTFYINSIPRFMIFDKNGILVYKEALRPSDPELLSILIKLIK